MMKSVTLRLDDVLHRRIRQKAFQEGVYMQTLVDRYLAEGLERDAEMEDGNDGK